MDRLKNKVAIVTGGAVGIGQSASRLLAKEGARVAVTDILDTEGDKTAAEIRAAGGHAVYRRCNVTKESEVQETLAEVQREFGRVDVLVNNAGVAGADKPTHELTEEEWDELMAVNVKGVFFCTKHVVPLMRENGGGSIVNLSSIYGLVGAADLPPYHASKGAVRLMTKNDALLYAAENIRVNSVHPGYVWTPLVEELASESQDGVEAFRKELDSRHPVGHVGEPDDIGWGIVYLASDESKFVTGSELVIDGGYTAQ
jgi:NAD(P)-dependent dehydrogenase (short-subunit alcohol dehydrogenase family)